MSEELLQRLAELKARYVERLADRRAELASGLPRDQLIVLVHNLAGSGATYGYAAISDCALALEDALHAGQPAETLTQDLLNALHTAVNLNS